MSKAKWIMKQYWRVGTIRQLAGVAMGMLVLGRYYYKFIPPLADLGFIGAVLLGGILFLIFLGFGYIYDARIKLWNETLQVNNEKDPYTYIPLIRYHGFEYPFFFAMIDTMKKLSVKYETDPAAIDELVVYLSDYYCRRVDNRNDLFHALPKANEFQKEHPFVENESPSSQHLSLGHRAKKNSMLNIWRWNWVQNFTGLPQDVMVLTALLGGVVFAQYLVDGALPQEYISFSITYFAFPLFLLLLVAGWYYDKILKLWSPTQIVNVERNPYSYVPDPKLIAYSIPFFNYLLNFYMQLFSRNNLDKSELVKLARYFDTYSDLSAARDADMEDARKLRRDFGPVFTVKTNSESLEVD